MLKNKAEGNKRDEEKNEVVNENDIEMHSFDNNSLILSNNEEVVQKNVSFSHIEGMIHLNGKEVSMVTNDDKLIFYTQSNENINKSLVIRVEVIFLFFSNDFI